MTSALKATRVSYELLALHPVVSRKSKILEPLRCSLLRYSVNILIGPKFDVHPMLDFKGICTR